MTKNELQDKIKRQQKVANTACIIGAVIMILVTLFRVYISRNNPALYSQYPYLSLCLNVVFVLAAVLTVWVVYSNFKRIGLVCPVCKKILDRKCYESALTTRICLKCGRVIIEE